MYDLKYPIIGHFTSAAFRYINYEDFLANLDAETMDVGGAQTVVAEGLKEVEGRKISLQQLRNVIKAYKVHTILHRS